MKLKATFVLLAVMLIVAVGYLIRQQDNSKQGVASYPRARANHDTKRLKIPPSPLLVSITNPTIHWEGRLQSVNQLPNELDAGTTTYLFDYLSAKPAEESPEHWYVVCNEIMQTLRKRELPAGYYTRRLITIVESATDDPVIRDYAVQHLSQWIAGVDPEARETDPALAAAAFEAMCGQAKAPVNGQLTLVGTTLNALVDGMMHGDEAVGAKRESLQKIALKVAATADGSVANFNRATALQAAAQLDSPGLPELCRNLVTQPEVAADLRLGSVAALGLVGNASDLPLLQSFAANPSFQFAASAAIRRIQSRTVSH